LYSAVNQFRAANNVGPAKFDDLVSHYCHLHCIAMTKCGGIYHAEPYLLDGWSEAVGWCAFQDNVTSIKHILVDGVFGNSSQHRNLILSAPVLACAIHINNWQVYATIRGKY